MSGDSLRTAIQPLLPRFTSKAVLGRPNRARLEAVVRAIAAGQVVLNVAHRLPLAEDEQAHTLSRTGRVTGKIVVIP